MSDAPRITPEQIEANIRSCHYFTAYEGVMGERFHHEGADDIDIGEGDIPDELKLMTICIIILQCGFTVIGTSACVSEENYRKDIGESIARAKAVDQIWPLMGYRLRAQIYTTNPTANQQASAPSKGGEADRPDEGHDAVGTGEAEATLIHDLEVAAESAEHVKEIKEHQRVGDRSSANVSDPFKGL